MKVCEREYYRARRTAEKRPADGAAHPEAKRRHAELAEAYAAPAGSPPVA